MKDSSNLFGIFGVRGHCPEVSEALHSDFQMRKGATENRDAGGEGHIQIAKQVAVFLDNKPGTLARLCEALSEQKINIFAVSTSDTVDHIVVRLVLSDPDKALSIFEERGTLVVITEILMLDSDNKPGSLGAIAQKLAAAKINIDYAYCATHPKAHKGILILRVSDPKKALKILNT